MDDREFLLDLKRALSIMANDPSAGETQKRGLKMAVNVIDRRVKALPAIGQPQSIAKSNGKTRQPETPVLQS